MKRKIRKKRQLRLQQLKRKNVEYWDEEKEELRFLEEYFCRNHYAEKAELPYYAYIFVDFHYGWELYRPKKIVFLYDRVSHKIEYSRCIYNCNYEDIRNLKIDVSYKKMGEKVLSNDVFIDDMIYYKPRINSYICDCSSYRVYIKSGQLKRVINIQGPDTLKYEPFIWLFELFNEVSKEIPLEMKDKNDNWVDVHKYNLEHHPEMFESEK